MNDKMETREEETGLVEERLTVEIPTELQAGVAVAAVALPPCYYSVAIRATAVSTPVG